MNSTKLIKKEREKWLTWKNIVPLRDMLDALPHIRVQTSFKEHIEISADIKENIKNKFFQTAWAMRPWRKGPFKLFDIFIDSEWKSNIKFDILKNEVNLNGKSVADIGCNNGYYMFKMLPFKPKEIIGFDPSPLYKTQFDLFNKYIKSSIIYELLGVDDFANYNKKFDIAFCLGVLYHRSDPITTLKNIKKGLTKNGILILDTFMIDGNADIVLTPKSRYAKIPNIYFIPTINALTSWCYRAGFENVEVITTAVTTINEQRKTKWILGNSLESFLNPDDSSLTIEGYPAPKRVYMKMCVS